MKRIVINNDLILVECKGEELREKASTICKYCMPIVMSYEHNEDYYENNEKFEEILEDFAYDNDDNSAYLLADNNKVVAFAIFSKISNENTGILELIMTDNKKTSCGYGKQLIINSMKRLKKDGIDNIVSHFNVDNEKSAEFHNSLIKLREIDGRIYKDFDNICSCEFKLKTLNLINEVSNDII